MMPAAYPWGRSREAGENGGRDCSPSGSRQLICLEPDLRRRLRERRRAVSLQEKRLNDKLEEYVLLEVTLEKFLVEEYWPRVGPLPKTRSKEGPKERKGQGSGKSGARPEPRTGPGERAELKARYRDLAKRYHPDRAAPEDRAFFESRMAEINAAFEKGDLGRLRELERRSGETRGSAEGLLGRIEDLKISELVLERMIGLYDGRIGHLKESRVWKLMMEARRLAREGRDYLAEMTLPPDPLVEL